MSHYIFLLCIDATGTYNCTHALLYSGSENGSEAAGPGERRNGKSGLEGGSEGDSEGGGGG